MAHEKKKKKIIIQKIKKEIIPEKPSEDVIVGDLDKNDFCFYATADRNIVEKLQNKFNIKSISLDTTTRIKTYTFDASRNEVKQFLGEA